MRLYSIGLDGTARGRCREATGDGSKMRYKGSSGSPVLFGSQASTLVES